MHISVECRVTFLVGVVGRADRSPMGDPLKEKGRKRESERGAEREREREWEIERQEQREREGA